MSSEFLKSSAKVDQAVIDATSGPNASFEGMRERMKAALVAEGKIERDRESLGYGVRVLPGQHAEPTPTASPVPAPTPTPRDSEGNELLSRVVTVGGQSHLLTAYSDTGLDVLERGWRQSHGGTTN